jgi:hypothetical protein
MKRTTDQNRKMCSHCGNLFQRGDNSRAYFERAKYCGQACSGAAQTLRAESTRKPMAECFSKWVAKSDGCWAWTGGRDKDGYGAFSYGRKTYRAPKIALELDGRPVPDGMIACHHCDNPACVRPSHLYVGTYKQNFDDMVRRGRANFARKTA